MPSAIAIRRALNSGRARLRYIKSDEAWYAASAVKPMMGGGVEHQWSVGVDALTDKGREDGTYGEWQIEFIRLQNKLCAHIQVFVDGMAALSVTGLVEALATLGDGPSGTAEIEAVLNSLGFKDCTDRIGPFTKRAAKADA